MRSISQLKVRLLPAVRISFGLTILTLSILMVADICGLIPDESKAILETRKKFTESLAIQFSVLATTKDIKKIGVVMKNLVDHDVEMVSAALRSSDGRLLYEVGNHSAVWVDNDTHKSTSTHVIVPIYRGKKQWGSVEISFKPVFWGMDYGVLSETTLKLILFVAGLSFFGTLLIILRTLRQLDPSAVIPERVNAAFNTLAEGVLILDEKEQIVLANTAFAEKTGRSPDSLLGQVASQLNWNVTHEESKDFVYPWVTTIQTNESRIGEPLALKAPSGEIRVLTVNSAPISDSRGKPRGALVTFDDITELEKKNTQLNEMVSSLEESRTKIEEKNKELHFLATKDPLTNCLNRRSFNEQFQEAFEESKKSSSQLTCIMADIDHFKAVNDTYGHGVGDEVIKLLADILHENSRNDDLVGRYGGEEFCVVMPGLDVEGAVQVAERIRLAIKEGSTKKFNAKPRVTASLGVASIEDGAIDPSDLNNQADKALYVAKESGRNKVVKWDAKQIEQIEQQKDAAKQSDSAENEKIEKTESSPDSIKDSAGRGSEVNRLQVRIKNLETIASKYSKELQYKRSYDTLTGLPNQMLFYDRIKQAISRGNRFNQIAAVLTLDIDLFKRVNNAFGRGAGDTLLKELANRLSTILRASDGITLLYTESDAKDFTVCRLGADEFGILLTDLKDTQTVTWIVRRIFKAVSEPMIINDQHVFVTCNIGISFFPDDGSSPEILLNHASAARQYAKQLSGQNNYQIFDSQMHEASIAQMNVETELRKAIEDEEFVLYYQPKVETGSSSVSGMEALIRWKHPSKGLLTPYEFIGVAEKSGTIISIGEWVIRQACLQTKAWLEMGIDPKRVAVNLSTLQLRQKDFSDRIMAILDDVGVSPRYLELEITETVIMDNLGTAVETLNSLHNQGFWISIDDFGTGYSSLNYLKHLPLDTLKIDRSFLQDILTDNYDRTIVKTIIAMAHSMNLKVVAEGVETHEQMALLRQYSCDEIQGYLFSRPVPPKEATVWLRENVKSEVEAI